MTVTAKTKIINNACGLLGEQPYDDIEVSPAPPNLSTLLTLYDEVVDWALRRHVWLCCTTYASLTAAERGGNWRYTYVYDLPPTCVRLVVVNGAVQYAKGAEDVSDAQKTVIWSNSGGGLDVAYIERKAAEAFDADLRNIIAAELASRAAGPIQEDAAKAARLHARAMELIALAQGAEAGEDGGQDPAFPSTFAALRQSAG